MEALGILLRQLLRKDHRHYSYKATYITAAVLPESITDFYGYFKVFLAAIDGIVIVIGFYWEKK